MRGRKLMVFSAALLFGLGSFFGMTGCSPAVRGVEPSVASDATDESRIVAADPTAVPATATPQLARTTVPTTGPTTAPTAETVEPSVTPIPAVTATPTVTLVASPTAEPSRVPDPTAAPEPSPTPSPTAEPTVTPTPGPTATPRPTLTPDPNPSATPEPPIEDEDLEPTDYDGEVRAIRTASGAVVAVRDVDVDSFEVITPCYEVATVTEGLPLTGPLDVLIDPGHGGDEPGAVGPNGLVEADVNFDVAELLRAELLARGYTAELTRYGDVRVAIQSRAALANSLAPRVFISIHHNGGYPEELPEVGTEVFVQFNDPESARLGGLLFEEITAAFAGVDITWMGNEETRGVAWRQNDRGTDLYGVLRRTPGLISVLTEAMFLTTAAEAELLAQPETLQTEALALADGLDRWFTTGDPGSGFVDGVIFFGDLGNGGGTEGCVDPPLG